MRAMWVSACLVFAVPAGLAANPPQVPDALTTIEAKATATHSDALLIQRGNETLLEMYACPTPEPVALMSATKSIVALAIGLLLEDGKLDSIDQPVSDVFPEWAQGRKRDITIRMLLDHTSGLQNVPNAGVELESAPDLVQLALAAELASDPGSSFAYNNKATNLLTGIVGRLAGEPIDTYVATRIFAPLGITQSTWMRDEAGTPMGMAGLAMSARDLAKVGRLLLDKGVAPGGERILGEAFVDMLTAESARSADVGLLWWRNAAWERYTLKDDADAFLVDKDVAADVREAVVAATGRTFTSKGELIDFLSQRLGPAWGDRYGAEITRRGIRLTDLFAQERGPTQAYSANGYLGQYLVIVPTQDIVAVRQIHRRETHAFPDDDYADFVSDVLRLAEVIEAP
ncbi:serine hydrolase domain-containing protein [Luteimonas terrae]|uniref:CubicO group peptidase (Beta-lactamase class C family) n=1 Tax=Luteimonas terrae TaxID=1530191 RepID=A0ABU1XY18_9GAMM|nr:serine hydrolase domain-containing protein [Luteimonas terrae]MDR7193583.1 CubicO group peptidase (beta-lactamase class C family) [Luteimonas terrae]